MQSSYITEELTGPLQELCSQYLCVLTIFHIINRYFHTTDERTFMDTMSKLSHDPARRDFLKTTAIGTAVAAAAFSGIINPLKAAEPEPFHFPPLPYPENALEPYISARTLNIHHDRHYRKYVQQVAERVKGTDYQNATLEKIIKETYGGITMIETLHLMALLAWNHDFYWKSMMSGGGATMPERLKGEVTTAFGSIDNFKAKFKEAAMTLGSGWAWLVIDNGKPVVTYTEYHDTPLLKNQKPLLTLDCWEHAYYLDYQDRKGDYVDAFLNHLANWQFAESNLPATASAPSKTKTAKK